MAMRPRSILIFIVVAIAGYYGFIYWREHRFDKEIAAAAARYKLDPALVKAVIWQETRFRPHVHGGAGELGLMQVRSDAAFEWAAAERVPHFEHEDCLDPGTNTLAGAWYLSKVLLRYKQADDPLPYALADYNAGRGNVLKWRSGGGMTNSGEFVSQIQFPGTRAYVLNVIRRYHHYQ
jgi:soluble lytic murein transglycosylase